MANRSRKSQAVRMAVVTTVMVALALSAAVTHAAMKKKTVAREQAAAIALWSDEGRQAYDSCQRLQAAWRAPLAGAIQYLSLR